MTSQCGKVWYPSKATAKMAAKRARGRGGPVLRPYACQEGCPAGTWHLTSQTYARKAYFRAYDRDRMESTVPRPGRRGVTETRPYPLGGRNMHAEGTPDP